MGTMLLYDHLLTNTQIQRKIIEETLVCETIYIMINHNGHLEQLIFLCYFISQQLTADDGENDISISMEDSNISVATDETTVDYIENHE